MENIKARNIFGIPVLDALVDFDIKPITSFFATVCDNKEIMDKIYMQLLKNLYYLNYGFVFLTDKPNKVKLFLGQIFDEPVLKKLQEKAIVFEVSYYLSILKSNSISRIKQVFTKTESEILHEKISTNIILPFLRIKRNVNYIFIFVDFLQELPLLMPADEVERFVMLTQRKNFLPRSVTMFIIPDMYLIEKTSILNILDNYVVIKSFKKERKVSYNIVARSKGVLNRCRVEEDELFTKTPPTKVKRKVNRCPNCNEEIEERWNICPHCGTRLARARRPRCKQCGERITRGWKLCPMCGAKLYMG